MSATLHMGSADAAWLRMDGPANPMVINSLIRFEDSLDVERLGEVLQQRLVGRYPKFAMLAMPGRLPLVGSLPRIAPLPAVGPCWTPDQRFSIVRHLHQLALPQPATDQELMSLVGDLVSTPLPDDRPPWQAHLIEGNDGATAVLVRMHHCVADGIALAHVLLSLTDAADGSREREQESLPITADRPAGGAHQIAGLAHQGVEAALHPSRIASLARSGARDMETLRRLLLLPSESAGRELSGLRRVGISQPVDLDLTKRIAHSHHATVNDVLLAAVSGAMRSSLTHADVEQQRMTAIVPFNLRGAGEPPPAELGNRFGLVFLEMPVQEADRSRRLKFVKDRMDAIKRSPEGPLTYAVLQATGAAPAAVEQLLVEFFSAKGTIVVTNVPGPARQRSLAGARVRDLAIWAPASGSVGMSVSLFSYRGEVTVGLLCDTAVLQEPQAVADRVAAEIEALAPAHRSAA